MCLKFMGLNLEKKLPKIFEDQASMGAKFILGG